MVKLHKSKPIKLTKGANKMSKSTSETKKNDKDCTLKITNSEMKATNFEGLNMKNYEDGVQVLFELYAKISRDRSKKQLLDDTEEPIFLQIIGIKIPKCPKHTVRIDLPYSCHPKDIEICLISADLPNTNLRDYDKVIDHYENILKNQDVFNIKTIMSFHQLRNEYQEFEMKRKLVSAYNIFLADSKIHGKVVHFLGSTFEKSRKVPRILSFDKPTLKAQIERILSQTDVKLQNKGNSTGIQVGLVEMEKEHVLENIKAVVTKLPLIYPGGSDNIRSISIKTTKSMAIPLYLTLKMKSDVDIPTLKSRIPNKCVNFTDDLSTLLNTQVTVLPSGHVKTRLIKKRNIQEMQNAETKTDSEKTQSDKQEHYSTSTGIEFENVNESSKEEIVHLKQLNEIKTESKPALSEAKIRSVSKRIKARLQKSRNHREVVTEPIEDMIKKSPRRSSIVLKKLPEKSQTKEVSDIILPILRKSSRKQSKEKPLNNTDGSLSSTNVSMIGSPKPNNSIKVLRSSQAIITSYVFEETTKSTDKQKTDKRKSTSTTNTGSKKKQKSIRNPFYSGNTSK